jgi:hypothetical protein
MMKHSPLRQYAAFPMVVITVVFAGLLSVMIDAVPVYAQNQPNPFLAAPAR